jgi:hypothetical protein
MAKGCLMNTHSYNCIAELFGSEVLAAFKVVADIDATEFVPLRNMLDLAVQQRDAHAQLSAILLVYFAAEGLIATLSEMKELAEHAKQLSPNLTVRSPDGIAQRHDALKALVKAILISPEVAALRKPA